MRNSLILVFVLSLFISAVSAAEGGMNGGMRVPPPQPGAGKQVRARENAFEQKLGLTEEQKNKIRELRTSGHEEMKPIMDQLYAKKRDAALIKQSRALAVSEQEQKLNILDKEIKDLEKQANLLRRKNMKEFEGMLTREQKNTLKQMKQEGRQNYEQNRKQPCPCPP